MAVPCRATSRCRSRGPQSGYLAWSVDRPSKRWCGARMRRSRIRSLARLVDMAFQAPGEPGGDRAGRSWAQNRIQVTGQSGSAGRPAPPILHPSGEIRCEANGVAGVRPLGGKGSDPSPPASMAETIGQREGSDPGSAGYFSTTSASAATTPSGPTNTGLMSSSFSLGASAVAIWDAATKVLASASLSAAGLPR